jgi:hypothetical protein
MKKINLLLIIAGVLLSITMPSVDAAPMREITNMTDHDAEITMNLVACTPETFTLKSGETKKINIRGCAIKRIEAKIFDPNGDKIDDASAKNYFSSIPWGEFSNALHLIQRKNMYIFSPQKLGKS